jgi:triosephosphate isomerase
MAQARISRIMIVGNWKMHLNVAQASLLVHRLNARIKAHRDIEVVLSPSMLALQPLSREIDRRKFRLASQNANAIDEGAYTGEVSFTMLRGLVHYAIIGHSERRQYFNETLEVVSEKVAACVRNSIVPILCIGETAEERRQGETRQVLHDHLTTALHGLTAHEVANMVIAYEPRWAIGTGVTAKPAEIDDSIRYIRHQVAALYGEKTAEHVRILYGAGVEPEYVSGILSLSCGIDGLLVGGASLNYLKFTAIIDSAYHMVHSE